MSFGRDFEQQLSFCVEARATFCNLEPVIIHLIHVSSVCFSCGRCKESASSGSTVITALKAIKAHYYTCFTIVRRDLSSLLDVLMMFFMCLLQTVNQLAMETNHVMKGSHSRKTAAFVRVSFTLTPKHNVNNSLILCALRNSCGLRG